MIEPREKNVNTIKRMFVAVAFDSRFDRYVHGSIKEGLGAREEVGRGYADGDIIILCRRNRDDMRRGLR